MGSDVSYFANQLPTLGRTSDKDRITVHLSNELVTLLSAQLYQSPLKAIEELVIHAYDANASRCSVFVPASNDGPEVVLVHDDGDGMDVVGLANLWLVGRSNKRTDEIALRAQRKQIGKFGIGKLATYAIGNNVTYISRTNGRVLAVACDFGRFGSEPEKPTPVRLDVVTVKPWERLTESDTLRRACEGAGVDLEAMLRQGNEESWTVVLLEDLKHEIKVGRLQWVLSSAMPLGTDFGLFLNGVAVDSSKASIETVVEFQLGELPSKRLESANAKTGADWRVDGKVLIATGFEEGVGGKVTVGKASLHAGKSRDLGRSHGFFIKVRGRLINEDDALFGLAPLSYQTFNRFRAEVVADDLDTILTAQREGVVESEMRGWLLPLLEEVFYEARDRYETWRRKQDDEARRKKEHERTYVSTRLVEHPIADVLSVPTMGSRVGAEADDDWFYLDVGSDRSEVEGLVASLNIGRRDRRYRYSYTRRGRMARLVRFSPADGVFYINADHDLAIEYGEEQSSQKLLEDLATSEALLEVYLREHGMAAHVVGEVLERRDGLLRGLANERKTSVDALARFLEASSEEEYDLEVAVVAACRALGFVAKHVSGAGQPDGVGRFREYPGGEKKITLEAKSAGGTPTLAQLDFAGLREHVDRSEAHGCLLVAPRYPGETKGRESAVSERATECRVSCWTVAELARVVRAAESRAIGASQILNIVLEKFAPDDVRAAVELLLGQPKWEHRTLYAEIVRALGRLEGRLPDKARTVAHVAAEISGVEAFEGILERDVEEALVELAGGSRGGVTIRRGRVMANVSLEELERRVSALTGEQGAPRGKGLFGAGG